MPTARAVHVVAEFLRRVPELERLDYESGRVDAAREGCVHPGTKQRISTIAGT